jgi:apolipoprotein D and lipocalin family protein
MLKSKLAFLFLIFASVLTDAAPLITVQHVDLNRYMGKWYEIAAIPQYFQRRCVSDTTAEYKLLPTNRVQVYNSCETADRTRIASEGRAKVVDLQSNAKLKVTFTHLGNNYFYAFGGKYWITYLDSDYHYAIVGHPNRKYGWILSREPSLPQADLQSLVVELNMRSYDSCEFIITPQKNGFLTKSRLCDVVPVDSLEQNME